MFNIGPLELIVVFIVALIVIGPKKMPDLARALGRAIGEFKKATRDLQSSLDVDLNPRNDNFAPRPSESSTHQPGQRHRKEGKQSISKPENSKEGSEPEKQDPETTGTEEKNIHDR
jgi:TatA/E family protein of Tat protein translocase